MPNNSDGSLYGIQPYAHIPNPQVNHVQDAYQYAMQSLGVQYPQIAQQIQESQDVYSRQLQAYREAQQQVCQQAINNQILFGQSQIYIDPNYTTSISQGYNGQILHYSGVVPQWNYSLSSFVEEPKYKVKKVVRNLPSWF